MVAVDIWASQIAVKRNDREVLWIMPSIFFGTMAVGFLMAVDGIDLPFVEPAILTSIIGLCLLVTAAENSATPVSGNSASAL